MLNPKLTAKSILTHECEEREVDMFFIQNDNFEIEDIVESTLEDWRLPPSIEDEDAMLGGIALDIILEEATGEQGEATLYLLI